MAKDCEVLLPAIVVLNRRYLITDNSAAAKVGAAAFAASVVQAFEEAGIFLGVILYHRDEHLLDPYISSEAFTSSLLTVTLSFNFNMAPHKVSNALTSCIRILSAAPPRTADSPAVESPPMLYYQTDTLLEYHPRQVPLCVTHHGPFYGSFAGVFSREAAAMAFGSVEKAEHLDRQQRKGIEYLRTNQHAYVLQHSQLQGDYLASRGVTALRDICPPIELLDTNEPRDPLPAGVAEWFAFDGIVLFTAVARLDYFKNIDLLVDAAVSLLLHSPNRQLNLRVLIAGGDQPNSLQHASLLSRIPAHLQHAFLMLPKMSRSALYALFATARPNGIFICPSRYETLGITPLEAALNGVTTLISDSRVVEASRFYPARYRFTPSPSALATLVSSLAAPDICLAATGDLIRLHVGKAIQGSRFRADLLDAWAEFSTRYVEASTGENLIANANPNLGLAASLSSQVYRGLDMELDVDMDRGSVKEQRPGPSQMRVVV